MKTKIFSNIFVLLLFLSSPAFSLETVMVKLIAINKITAKSTIITIKKGELDSFGNLEIKLHNCQKDSSSPHRGSKALLEIVEVNDSEKKVVFTGWMFNRDSSVSHMEHPIYDITVKECIS